MFFFPFSANSSSAADASITTVRDFLRDALMEIGAIGEKQPLETENAQRALRIFKAMARRYAGDRWLIYTASRQPFPLVANQQTYTMGLTGDFAVRRPLLGLGYVGIIPAGQDFEIEIDLISRAQWMREPMKSLTDTYPRKALYEPTTPSLGTWTFWPIPTSAPTFVVETPEALIIPDRLDTNLIFPPGGYEEAWRLNLAKRLARPFGKIATPELKADAAEALGAVRRLNDPGPPFIGSDPALTGRGGYNIYTNRTR